MLEQFIDVDFILGHMNYWFFVVLMMTGLYVVVARGNLLKKIVGLNLFQAAVFMLYISMGKVAGGTAPIFGNDPDYVYSSPLPHVLILTAIVVGIATTSLGLALIVRINEVYDSIEEEDILHQDHLIAAEEAGVTPNPIPGEAEQ
ncbi:MAG: cation:proton antiporter subunit C [Pseudomonadota bacterium]